MTAPELFKVRLESAQELGPADMDAIERWAREGRVSRGAVLIPVQTRDGPAANAIPVIDVPRLRAIVDAPPTIGGTVVPPPPEDEIVATVIPYRNKPALIGYYLAIFGCLFAILIPVLGFGMPIAAIILGVKGLKAVKADPRKHGKAHAIIALVGGVIGTLLAMGNFAAMVLILVMK